MIKINVLITSSGMTTTSSIVFGLHESDFEACITGTDVERLTSGTIFTNKYYITPKIEDPSYIDCILSICKQEKIDFIFPINSKEINLFSKNKDKFGDTMFMLPSSEIIDLCMNKVEFYKFLDSYNISHPNINFKNLNFPLISKPAFEGTPKDINIIEDRTDLNYYSNKFPNNIIQEFISGTEYTVSCLRHNNIINSYPVERIRVKDGKCVLGKTVEHSELIKLSEEILTKLDFNGACNIQFIEREDKLYCIELNPRLAAGSLPLVIKAGLNIPALMVGLTLGASTEKVDYKRDMYMIRSLDSYFIELGSENNEVSK
jgi:carbamoyl-phosphate synthase large subunit